MPLEVTVGPPQLAISEGETILITEEDAQIRSADAKGLYFRDTRMVSSWTFSANGASWELQNSGALTHFAARTYLTNPELRTERGAIPRGALSLVVSRSVGGGVHEDVEIVNEGMKAVQFNLEMAMRGDFADIFEVKSDKIVRRGRIVTTWSSERQTFATAYRNKDFSRSLTLRIEKSDGPAVYANGRVTFDIALEPKQRWRACLLYDLADGDEKFSAPPECFEEHSRSAVARRHAEWKSEALAISSSNGGFCALYEQSLDDMAALRLPIEDTDHLRFIPAAGVPWFVALFGRDSLMVSLQTMLVYPDFARGALRVLGALQATERDDYRDAEPGKILHEMRLGELAHFKLIPHTPYYGAADATILYLIVLHAAWLATGDRKMLEDHLPIAEKCLEWIDRYGDRDGDGFQEYATRSPAGYENQGWKDSGEAIVDADGAQVVAPKALCELQGYVYDAWLRMADIYDFVGQSRRAGELRRKAGAMFDRFNAIFWDEEAGYYALALDGAKKKATSVASNAGLCLWSGVVRQDRAARVVGRMMKPDMCSGWGIRTLSADNPSYNPYSYQNGSVWPHDNGFIAQGFRRYGFDAEAGEIARQLSAAAGFFEFRRLPELYAGITATPFNFPVQYIGANVPQAWAAGSIFMMLSTLLGVQPDAPRGKLYVDPALPEWLPDLELHGLRLGDKRFDLRFWRDRQGSHWAVAHGDKKAVEHRPFTCAGWRTPT